MSVVREIQKGGKKCFSIQWGTRRTKLASIKGGAHRKGIERGT